MKAIDRIMETDDGVDGYEYPSQYRLYQLRPSGEVVTTLLDRASGRIGGMELSDLVSWLGPIPEQDRPPVPTDPGWYDEWGERLKTVTSDELDKRFEAFTWRAERRIIKSRSA